jgi:hypothetical protein
MKLISQVEDYPAMELVRKVNEIIIHLNDVELEKARTHFPGQCPFCGQFGQNLWEKMPVIDSLLDKLMYGCPTCHLVFWEAKG